MTVPSQIARDEQSGNGSTTVFTVPFRILEAAHLLVTTTFNGVITIETLDSDYTVSNVGQAQTTVTFDEAPPTGTTITFRRNVPVTQETDYVPNDPFPAQSHEDALDKLTMIAQQLNDTYFNNSGDVVYNTLIIGGNILFNDTDNILNVGTIRYRIPVKTISTETEILDRLYTSCHVVCTSPLPVTLTLRANDGDEDLDFGTGDHIVITQNGAGAVTVTPDTGVTILAPAGFDAATRAQYSVIALVCEDADTNTWKIGNDLAETAP